MIEEEVEEVEVVERVCVAVAWAKDWARFRLALRVLGAFCISVVGWSSIWLGACECGERVAGTKGESLGESWESVWMGWVMGSSSSSLMGERGVMGLVVRSVACGLEVSEGKQ